MSVMCACGAAVSFTAMRRKRRQLAMARVTVAASKLDPAAPVFVPLAVCGAERSAEEKPDEKPEERPEEKPEEKPEERPEKGTEGRPEEKPEEKPEERPEEKPEEKPAKKPENEVKVDFLVRAEFEPCLAKIKDVDERLRELDESVIDELGKMDVRFDDLCLRLEGNDDSMNLLDDRLHVIERAKADANGKGACDIDDDALCMEMRKGGAAEWDGSKK